MGNEAVIKFTSYLIIMSAIVLAMIIAYWAFGCASPAPNDPQFYIPWIGGIASGLITGWIVRQ